MTTKGVSLVASIDAVTFFSDGNQPREYTYFVQNRSNTTVLIRAALRKGSNECFKLTAGANETAIAIGLKKIVTILYTPPTDTFMDIKKDSSNLRDVTDDLGKSGTIDIYAEDKLFLSIPVEVRPPVPHLVANPTTIDYGRVVAEGQVEWKKFTLTNDGAIAGPFVLKPSSCLVELSTYNGTISPSETIDIKVGLQCSAGDGPYEGNIRICSSEEEEESVACSVTLLALMQSRQLQLLDITGSSPVTCISFGAVYYGMEVCQQALLFNNCPEHTSFVIALNEQAAGTEVGVDKTDTVSQACTEVGLGPTKWKEQGTASSPSSILEVTPMQGVFTPYGKRVVQFRLHPTFYQSRQGWTHHQGLPARRDYALFVKIMPVSGLESFKTERGGHIEVAVSATVLPVELNILPKNCLTFGPCVMGKSIKQKCSIENASRSLPIHYVVKAIAHYKISCHKGKINPGTKQDMEIVFMPRQMGILNSQFCINVMAVSPSSIKPDTVIHSACLKVMGAGTFVTKERSIKPLPYALSSDRATSIRPHDRRQVIKTPFTKIPRYTYIDPEYSLTPNEENEKIKNQQVYVDYISQLRKNRICAEKDKLHSLPQYRNSTDINIKPSQGIMPKVPTIKEQQATGLEQPIKEQSTVYTTTQLQEELDDSLLTFLENPPMKVTDPKIHQECQKCLVPMHQVQVKVEPDRLQFGDVILNIDAVRVIVIKNYSPKHVHIKFKFEYSQVSCVWVPLQSEVNIILPSQTYTSMPLLFNGGKLGMFDKNISYTVNGHHHYRIPVTANVVEMSVSLSTNELILSEPLISPVNAGFYGSIKLTNKYEVPASFSWKPSEEDSREIAAFYPQHSSGVIPANSTLECEFIYHAAYNHSDSATFNLLLDDGKNETIKCIAKYKKPTCQFSDQRLLLGYIPLNLITIRYAVIINSSKHHAYYKVVDANPHPGVIVTPNLGCVPANGKFELTLQLKPQVVELLDFDLSVKFRAGNIITIRVGASVEPPLVTIDKEAFRFGGVFSKSTVSTPFKLVNKGNTRAHLIFDLSYFTDFSITMPDQNDPYAEVEPKFEGYDTPGIYCYNLQPNNVVECMLHFTPQDVAAYDFILPILINGYKAPTPPPSPWPPSNDPYRSSLAPKVSHHVPTPARRVLATVLKPLLDVSTDNITFEFSASDLDSGGTKTQSIKLCNKSKEDTTWIITFTESNSHNDIFKFITLSGQSVTLGNEYSLEAGEDCELVVLCCPTKQGTYSSAFHIMLNGDKERPYRYVKLMANVPSGTISCEPAELAMIPAPLNSPVSAIFVLVVQGFLKTVQLEVSLPTLESGIILVVDFVDSHVVENCSEEAKHISCSMTFMANKPISLSNYIVITDIISGKRKEFPFSVTADNSILTVYNFLAQHMADFELIYHNNLTPMLVPSIALQPPPSSSSDSSLIMEQSSFLVSSQFDDMFVQDIVAAVCRWLSVFGWPNRLYHFSAPEILRRGWDNDNSGGHQMKKQVKSGRPPKSLLLEMIAHLCGRLPPGISVLMPPCKNDSERVKAHYTTASILLTFIKSQGGLLWSLKPEAFLDYKDFLMWCSENTSTYSNLPEEYFNIISKQSWTHLLMQIIKVLVLPTVESSMSKTLRHKIKGLDTCASNIYGVPECILLTWLNHHYEEQYPILFPDSETSEQRYVKSFDVDLMDSMVLACVITAYIPYLASIYFQELYPFPTSAEQCSHNAIILIKAMRHIGLDYDVQTTDITSPNPVTMLLLCCYLYKNLPQYRPTATLSFEAAMNTTVVQNIKLDNPSIKCLVYSAIIIGPHSSVFCTASTSKDVTIAGKSSKTMDIHFCGSAISDFEATLFLVGRLGGIACGSTLTFALRGSVTGAKPEVVVDVNAPLYELQYIPLTVSNPFSQPATFEISLCEQPGSLPFQKHSPDKLKEKKRMPKGDQKKMILTNTIKKGAKDNLQLFYSVKNTVRLRPAESVVLEIKHVPIILAKRYCIVTLSCKDVGETIYSIQVNATLPRPLFPFSSLINPRTLSNNDTKTLYLKTNAEETVKEELVIPSCNSSMEAALLELAKWRMTEAEYNRRRATGTLNYAALAMAISQLGLTNVPATYNDKIIPVTTTEYNVEHDSTAEFSLPSSLRVSTDAKSSAVLPIEFRAEVPGQYECHITLRSKYDVRVYIIEATVLEKGRYATLEFDTRATEPITQQIPIVNPSSVDWNLKASLTGAWFTGPKLLVAKAIATTNYPLTFSPIKPGGWEGELQLLNTNDGSKHIFKLIGKAKRPLAQGHIVLKGQVKKRFVHKFHVPNHGEKTVIFQVESDISFISGPPTLTVGPGETTEYEATITPLYQGNITGVLSFTAVYMSNKSQSFMTINKDRNTGCHRVWFTVELDVNPAPPDYTITLVSPVLSSINAQLKIDSPHFEPLQLEVLVKGHGLSGPDKLSVEPGGEETCIITYSPTLVGETTGRVVFTGSPDGEFWYHLTLVAQDPDPVVMDVVECPLGCTVTTPITLVNPHANPITITVSSISSQHFTLVQDVKQLVIKPSSSLEVPVIFKPSKFGDQHDGEIIFTSKELGQQLFKFRGNGLYPTVMPVVDAVSALTCSAVTILSFANPLDHAEYFNVEMDGKDVEHFCLLLKQTTRISLNPGITLDIPISFSPEVMKRHECRLTISVDSTSQPLKWHYPIIGQPHLRPFSATSGPLLQCRAKERLEQRLEISLVGSENSRAVKLRPITPAPKSTTINTDTLIQDANDETYTYRLSCKDTEFGFLVEQYLGIRLIRKSLDPETNNPVLLFHIIFVPSKVIRCTVELEVRGIAGGVWTFPITVDALESKPDDVIVIEAQGLNKETTVGFRLTSMEKHPVPFTAHIVSATNEFSVHPTSGELPAIGSQGNLICVSYKPQVYGKSPTAKVVIQSPNNTWNYEIIGRSPSYSTPRSGPSTYKLTTPTRVMHRETNFIRKNIRTPLTPSTIKLHNLQ